MSEFLTNDVDQDLHVILKRGLFFVGDSDESFKQILFDSIEGISRREHEDYGYQYLAKLSKQGSDTDLVLWIPERFAIDFFRRLVPEENASAIKDHNEPLTENFALRGFYKEKENSNLVIYLRDQEGESAKAHKLPIWDKEEMLKSGVPSWEDAGKFKDASKQADHLYKMAVKLYGEF